MKLTIAYFYPQQLNLYGDNGNVEILAARAYTRGFDVEIVEIRPDTIITPVLMNSVNVAFMGGGPDAGQKEMYEDLFQNKGPYLRDFIENGGASLFVCGSYQLLGRYYKSADGSILEGLGIYDMYTQHFGNHRPRCIGNTVCEISPFLLADPVFENVNRIGSTLVGFENHGGRTYLDKNMQSLAKVRMGHGNNSLDGTEGVLYKSSIGTYMHGPVLSKNPHLADFLIAKGLKLDTLAQLDDTLISAAHTASKKLAQ